MAWVTRESSTVYENRWIEVRDGALQAQTRITGIEMFRKHVKEVTVGELSGLVLREKIEIARGDVIRPAPSG